MKDLFQHSGFRWLTGGFFLGAVLGICFFILLRSSPGRTGDGISLPPGQANELASGLLQSKQLLELGKNEEAASTLESMIKRFPESPEPYNNLAVLKASQGELETSREMLEKALKTNTSYSAVYENLGVIYSEIARNSYGKALRLELPPSTPQLKILEIPLAKGTLARASAHPASRPAPAPSPAPHLDAVEPAAATPAPAAPAPDPAPAAPPAEKPSPQKTKAAQDPKTEEALKTVLAWASAWSEQDTARYLSYYSEKFSPEEGLSRKEWEQQRDERIQHPSWIKVTVRNAAVKDDGSGILRAEFIQEYKADTYQDRTRKVLELVQEDGSWRILNENSLGRAR